MAISKAQQRAVMKYNKNNYDMFLLRMPKGKKNIVENLLKEVQKEKPSESLNSFLWGIIAESLGEQLNPPTLSDDPSGLVPQDDRKEIDQSLTDEQLHSDESLVDESSVEISEQSSNANAPQDAPTNLNVIADEPTDMNLHQHEPQDGNSETDTPTTDDPMAKFRRGVLSDEVINSIEINLNSEVGSELTCPNCKKLFIKKRKNSYLCGDKKCNNKITNGMNGMTSKNGTRNKTTPAQFSEITRLREIEKLTFSEIEKITGVKRETARQLYERKKQKNKMEFLSF